MSTIIEQNGVRFRRWGTKGPVVVLVHGGPGAAGYLAPLARELEPRFQIIEPFQRRSGEAALTVDRHVADLQAIIESAASDHAERPIVVGHSWGAMLGLAHTAAYPVAIRSLVLIGCGTFDPVSRERMNAIRTARMTPEYKARVRRIERSCRSHDEKLKALGRLFQRIDSVELIRHEDETVDFDARGHQESWQDMMRLQEAGVYPGGFAAIEVPVLMLHGAEDPHPGEMIRDSLLPYLPQLEYQEFDRCGHYPWLEKNAREAFLRRLTEWLDDRPSEAQAGRQ